MLRIFGFFITFALITGRFCASCMERNVSACINIMNSTNEKIRLVYQKPATDISGITNAKKNWDETVFEIESGKPALLVEEFSDFNQFGKEEIETEMCKILVEYEKAIIANIILVRSMYSPCPFFEFRNIDNKFGIILREETPVGGGLTTFEILHFSQSSKQGYRRFKFD